MLGDFEEKFRIPYAIIFGLIMAVILSKENESERMPIPHKVEIKSKEIDLNSLWGKVEFSV